MKTLGERLEKLIAEREKLRVEWQANRRERGRLEINLDRCTTNLAKLTGLEALLDPVGWKRS
jgi:hypothetical protein